jgi:hypothetical protein
MIHGISNIKKSYLFLIIVLAFIEAGMNFQTAGNLCDMLHGNEPENVLGFMC